MKTITTPVWTQIRSAEFELRTADPYRRVLIEQEIKRLRRYLPK